MEAVYYPMLLMACSLRPTLVRNVEKGGETYEIFVQLCFKVRGLSGGGGDENPSSIHG